MEVYFGEVLACHGEHIAGISEEDVAPFAVNGHELVFAFLESSEGFGIVTFNPAGFIERDWFPAALCTIFMEQTILDNLKLELADSADNFAAIELIDKELGDALVHELLNAFFELF